MKQTVNKCYWLLLYPCTCPKTSENTMRRITVKYLLWSVPAKWPTIVVDGVFRDAEARQGKAKAKPSQAKQTNERKRKREEKVAPAYERTSTKFKSTEVAGCLQVLSKSWKWHPIRPNAGGKTVWWHLTMPSSSKGKLYVAHFLSLSWTSVLLYITIINKVSIFFFWLLCVLL